MSRDPFENFGRRNRIPVFFKLWFAFVMLLALVIIGGQIWLGATILTSPDTVGRFIGEIVDGFEDARQ